MTLPPQELDIAQRRVAPDVPSVAKACQASNESFCKWFPFLQSFENKGAVAEVHYKTKTKEVTA